jgi:hypothetical protein
MKYRIEWIKMKNKGSSHQHITVFNPDDVSHIVKNLKQDPMIVADSVDFYPVFGE